MINTEVQGVQQDIIKCSCCHMKYFKCDFEGKRLGQIYKTCIKCRCVAKEKRKNDKEERKHVDTAEEKRKNDEH